MSHNKEMVEDLASGDIILFSGSHPLHRLQIERTGCPWAQVGLILRVHDETLVFESTKISTCVDVRLNAVHRGVQWVRLLERVMSFDGAIAARRLEPPLSGSMLDRFTRFADETHGLPFNDSRWVAFRSMRRRNPPSTGSGFFCSELVAEAYQRIGLIASPPQGRTSNNYIPADFSAMYSDRMLPMLLGFRAGDERLIKASVRAPAPLVASWCGGVVAPRPRHNRRGPGCGDGRATAGGQPAISPPNVLGGV